MVRTILVAILFAFPAHAQAVLDADAVPGLTEAGRKAYADFLLTDLPRAFAIGSNGAFGFQGSDGYRIGNGDIEVTRAKALQSCTANGATDCAIYAENLDVVWHGRAPAPNLVPAALTSTWNYEIVPDNRFFWHGPATAAGVYLWGHGSGGTTGPGAANSSWVEMHGRQPPPYARALNDVGFDILRFDRDHLADTKNRAAGWMADTLADLRKRGYRRIVVGGQSRAAWNSLQMLTHAGLVDAVIAVSPAAQGLGGDSGIRAQMDDLRQIFDDVPQQRTRLAFIQFAGDPYASTLSGRSALVEGLRPKLGGLLVIDQPSGFTGHYGGNTALFGQRYAECLRRFVLDSTPPNAC